MEKEIFLDIACFFDTMPKTQVMEILDARGFHPDIGVRVLLDKSLLAVAGGVIYMHDLLKELGRSIVRKKSPKEPRRWSRLWDYEDFLNVMLEHKEAENVEAIVVRKHKEEEFPTKTMRADALSQMSRLNLLILEDVEFSGSHPYLSIELRYLEWGGYPFTCLPSSFPPDKLVQLISGGSNIKQLWGGTKPPYNLRHMDLSHSKNLIQIPNFREVPNLKRLNLEGCIKLVRIDPSISVLRNLKNCENLVNIPENILDISSLEVLNLSGCSKLNMLSVEPRHMKRLKMFDTSEIGTHWQPASSICKMLMLPLSFFYPRKHEEPAGLLLPSLPNFSCLRHLDLSFCNLLQIPDSIGSLHCLE